MHVLTLALLACAAALYAAGARRRHSYAHIGSFVAGIAVLAVAALAPMHAFLWTHMVQHELLMVVAAPLIVLGRPLHAVPLRLPRWLHDPLLAWSAHAAALWLWHAPPFFEAALARESLHFAQHASFVASALLFWWTVLGPRARSLVGVLSLFTTMLHTGALGALMTFSRHSWYAGYGLEDQQLAGLVMWIPAGLAYPAAALFIGSRWLRRSAA